MSHDDRNLGGSESDHRPPSPDDQTLPPSGDPEETLPPGQEPAAPRRAGGALPDRIGVYPVAGELGRGGMGVVYVAEDPRLKRRIAIKVLPEAVAGDPQWLARFEREAQLLAALNHPNIATIHSLEEAGGLRFLTLELIAGDNLSARIENGPLAVDDALAVCRQIAAALEAAHKNGVIHLDMKPGNVRITPDGLVKVLDFGLARALTTGSTAEQVSDGAGAGGITGTPGYMSPEQVGGGALDHRTDLWALGCILYECLTGSRAIPGDTLGEVFRATVEREPEWRALPGDLPDTLRKSLTSCLAKDVAARPESATELRRAIDDAIQERALSALAYTRPEKSDAAPNNLPVQITSFVGRQRERTEIRELLARTHLLTLSGMGGSGKTRLALEVAREIIGEYDDGTWLVELAPLSSAQFVPQTVATVLGLKEERNRPLADTVVAYLRERSILLIVDNCEHLLPECAHFVATLLRGCPGLRVIATSREGLGIAGESIYQVTSLGVPSPGREPSLEELMRVESVELFLERARAVKPDFALTADNAPATVEICRRLDGIPLAIELAVARVKMMSVGEIASRLDDRFRLLTGGSRTALPHHKTLRALIDWSYEGLTEHEAALMRRLAAFAGGWTLDAAAAVGAGEDLEEWEVLDLLSRLVDKSLVELDAEGGQRTGKTRYRMLETVRSYARERLDEHDETDSVRRRHLDYFLSLAEEVEPQLLGGEQGLWLARLEAEHDNLRVAIDACKAADPALGLRLAGALGQFWEVHGHWSEGREVCAALATRPDGGDPAIRAKVLLCAGNLALHQGDAAEARRAYEESLEIRRQLGDKQGSAQSLNSLGLVSWIRGDHDQAGSFFEESLAICRELGDPRGTASSLNNLGNLARDRGDHEAARSFHEESLAIKRELGDRRGIASSLNNLGVVLRRLGDNDRARSFYEESLEIRRELGDRQGIAQSLNSLGNLAEERADYEEARALYVESLAIKRELGDRRGVAVSLFNLGEVLRKQGDHDGARSLLEESLEHRSELGPMGMSAVLVSIGLLAASRGELVRAARLLGAADRIGEALGPHPPDPERAEGEAALRASMGDDAFERERAEGRVLTLEQAIALGKAAGD